MRVGVWPAIGDANPFVALFAAGLRSAGAQVVDVPNPAAVTAGSIDVLHIHWPEQVFWGGGGVRGVGRRLLATLRSLHRLRRSGVVVVWMVHNLEPHDMTWRRRALWWPYRQQLCALSHGFMTLSPATIDVVRHALPGLRAKPARFVWHPAYPPVAADPPPAAIRRQLGVSDGGRLYGFLGMLRPYKGIEALVGAFRQLDDSRARLLLAGQPFDPAYARLLAELATPDPRISLVARRLSDAEFSGFQAAVDVVVLPFQQSLHSGSMVHAICEGRPVVTTDTPFARALGQEVGAGWITTYEKPLGPHLLLDCQAPATLPNLRAFSVENLGAVATAFYKELLAQPPCNGNRQGPATIR